MYSFFNQNVVFPAKAEYSYFSDYFKLEIFLFHSLIMIAYEFSDIACIRM